METINIGVASWIIQDGNYHDFSLGETHQFALEFYAPKPLKRSREQMPQMVAVVGNEYDVKARVAFVDKNVWVIDAGLLMYRQEAPQPRGNRWKLDSRQGVGRDRSVLLQGRTAFDPGDAVAQLSIHHRSYLYRDDAVGKDLRNHAPERPAYVSTDRTNKRLEG